MKDVKHIIQDSIQVKTAMIEDCAGNIQIAAQS